MGYEKYYSHLIVTFYLNRDNYVLEIFPVAVVQYKLIIRDDPFTGNRKRLKLLDSGRKIQNDVHIDTYYCKPELIS